MSAFPSPAELVYSECARCEECGAGLAYVKGLPPLSNLWACSRTLLGQEEDHADSYPFAFWKLTSELQPRVAGRTTRPAVKP